MSKQQIKKLAKAIRQPEGIAAALVEQGFDIPRKVRGLDSKQLAQIKGIGPVTAEAILAKLA